MQCVNCRFQNIPGSAECGRCGTSLRLGDADIDVNPPRATGWEKLLRRFLPVRRVASTAAHAASGAARAVAFPIPDGGVLLRLVAPGWPQFHLGRRERGWAFLGAYLGLMLLALLGLGSGLGSVFFGLAVSVHAASVIHALEVGASREPSRWAVAAAALLGLSLGLYLPGGWLLTRFVDTVTVAEEISPFQAGDVILVSRWAHWRGGVRPGDLALYTVARATGGYGDAGVYIGAGQAIDRVVAGPGARAEWRDGKLWVDGVESPWGPLNPGRVPGPFVITVPAGHALILPTTMPYTAPGGGPLPPALFRRLAVVSADDVEGVARLRLRPLARFGRIR